MGEGTTYDVFVSHNGLDKPLVERLCRALLEAGVRPWFDKWDLAPGDLWLQEIERVLAQVSAVLVCVGAHGWSASHEAEWRAAVERAISKGSGVVVPVVLPGAAQDVELSVFLRDRQKADLSDEAAWEAEVARLAATLTGQAPRGPWIDEGRERPYRGLQPFTEADAGWMFGHERVEAELLDRLRSGERFIAVVGASLKVEVARLAATHTQLLEHGYGVQRGWDDAARPCGPREQSTRSVAIVVDDAQDQAFSLRRALWPLIERSRRAYAGSKPLLKSTKNRRRSRAGMSWSPSPPATMGIITFPEVTDSYNASSSSRWTHGLFTDLGVRMTRKIQLF